MTCIIILDSNGSQHQTIQFYLFFKVINICISIRTFILNGLLYLYLNDHLVDTCYYRKEVKTFNIGCMMRCKVRGHRVDLYLQTFTQVIPKSYYFNLTGVNILDSLKNLLEGRCCVTCEMHSNNPHYRSHAAVCLHLKYKHIFAYSSAYISLIVMKSTPCIDIDLMMLQLKYEKNR